MVKEQDKTLAGLDAIGYFSALQEENERIWKEINRAKEAWIMAMGQQDFQEAVTIIESLAVIVDRFNPYGYKAARASKTMAMAFLTNND